MGYSVDFKYRETPLIESKEGYEEELAPFVGQLVGIQCQFDDQPTVGRLEKAGDRYKLILLPPEVSIPADCPAPSIEGYRVEYKRGGGGEWVVHLPLTEKRKIPCLVYQDTDWMFPYRLEFRRAQLPSLEERERVEALLREHRSRYFQEQRRKEAEQRLCNWDAVTVREFNKAPFFGKAPEGYLVSFVKETTCGNTTVILMRDQEVVRVPNEIKGLVIGRGGRRIKALEERAGHRIRIV